MLVKAIRNTLGYSIAAVDILTRVPGKKRSAAQQAAIDDETARLALYQFTACPFCIKTRRAIHKLGLNINTRDAMNDPIARSELEQRGGRIKVPCLRISEQGKDDVWMYESKDIISYLQQRFG